MLITKEQQEAWVSNYVKEKHTQDECIGFIDGVEKALDVVNKKFDLAFVSGRSEQLKAFDEVFQIAWELVQNKSDYDKLLKIRDSF